MTTLHRSTPARSGAVPMALAVLLALLAATAAGCDEGPTGPGSGQAPTNKVRVTLDCDLNGVNGEMTMEIEAVGTTGIVWGGGSNPDISGVIGTGSYTYYTSGDLRSPVAYYVFTGQNQFADFTETSTYERFRVQWVERDGGLLMIINPFGRGPTQHSCTTTSATYI